MREDWLLLMRDPLDGPVTKCSERLSRRCHPHEGPAIVSAVELGLLADGGLKKLVYPENALERRRQPGHVAGPGKGEALDHAVVGDTLHLHHLARPLLEGDVGATMDALGLPARGDEIGARPFRRR
eukprot:scaffold326929_cov67-Tisochrysis_lutea.AAC.2